MTALILQNSNHNILVIGSIYDRMDALENAFNLKDNYDLLIINGNVCYPNNLEDINNRIKTIDKYLKTGKCIYNVGQFDLQFSNKLDDNNEIKKWINNKSNVIIINFINQSSIIILGGGITTETSRNNLYDNLEVSFVSKINNVPWHKLYGGGLGYIISNNPLTNEPPQFYNYSAQIGNYYSNNLNVYAQEINQFGLKKTILL